MAIMTTTNFYPTSWRSKERWMFSPGSVCLCVGFVFVCLSTR